MRVVEIKIRKFRPWRDELTGWVTVEEMLRAAAAKRCPGRVSRQSEKRVAMEHKDVERQKIKRYTVRV